MLQSEDRENNLLKKKKRKKSFASRCLTSGTTPSWYEHILFWYSHLTFPDGSFCVSAAEVASPVPSAISANFLINLISTEFYKHKHTLRVVCSHPKHLHMYKPERSNGAWARTFHHVYSVAELRGFRQVRGFGKYRRQWEVKNYLGNWKHNSDPRRPWINQNKKYNSKILNLEYKYGWCVFV